MAKTWARQITYVAFEGRVWVRRETRASFEDHMRSVHRRVGVYSHLRLACGSCIERGRERPALQQLQESE